MPFLLSYHIDYCGVFYHIIFSIRDGDSVLDIYDNCMNIPNAEQSDIDGDNIGKILFLLHDFISQLIKPYGSKRATVMSCSNFQRNVFVDLFFFSILKR